MAKRKTNKSEAIRQYMAKHPKATAMDVAKALKVQASLVYQVKMSQKKKTTKRPPATIATNVEAVIAAANLVKLCGGTEQARQALKAADKVLAVLKDK